MTTRPRLSEHDAHVIVHALSRCAAERRIAEARTTDPEVRGHQDAQARQYEAVLARIHRMTDTERLRRLRAPPMAPVNNSLSSSRDPS